MTPMQSIKTGFKKSFVFSGRAQRSEFWWYFSAALIVGLLILAGMFSLLDDLWPMLGLSFILQLLFMSLVTASTRRIRDARIPLFITRISPLVALLLVIAGFLAYAYGALAYFAHDFTSYLPSQEAHMGVAIWNFAIVPFAYLISLAILAVFCIPASRPIPNSYGPNPHEVTP